MKKEKGLFCVGIRGDCVVSFVIKDFSLTIKTPYDILWLFSTDRSVSFVLYNIGAVSDCEKKEWRWNNAFKVQRKTALYRYCWRCDRIDPGDRFLHGNAG